VVTNCACAGTPNNGCTENLTIELRTDAQGGQTSWEIRELGTNALAASGSGYPNNSIVTDFVCLPVGCYRLSVLDAGGDGISGGGYILRTSGNPGQRIIDNRDGFTSGSISAIANGEGFCLPIGTSRLVFTSCDKLDYVNGQYMVANDEPAVNAVWVPNGANSVQDANTGYEFWFFNPNGGYSFRRFRSHATSDGFPATGPTRACHLRINNWAAANHIPSFTLMNVRIRSRVLGVNSEWGPACRFKIDPVRAACPFTQLENIPGNQFFSCNVTRNWGATIYCKKVTDATQYQFRFHNAELATPVIRTRTTWNLPLNWTPALPSGTYEVDVRAFKGGQWCVEGDSWGETCLVTIVGPNGLNGGGVSMSTTSSANGEASLLMSPNPNRGNELQIRVLGTERTIDQASMEVFDLLGQRITTMRLSVLDGQVNQMVAVDGLSNGTYVVVITAGSERLTQRLVISR
jgi:hypothetical protein